MKIISTVVEVLIAAFNVVVLVYVAVFSLFVSGFIIGAPRRNMTDTDWAVEALGRFFTSLGYAALTALVAFVVNFLLYSLVPRNFRAFKQMVSMRDSSRQRELKRVFLCAGICTGLIATTAILASAYGAYSIYRVKPAYFD